MAFVNELDEEMSTSVDRRHAKKFCSWFECAQLFVALSVPVAIGIYTVIQYNNDQAIAKENRRQDLDIANLTRLNDLEIAANNREKDLQIASDIRDNDSLIADDQQKENILVEYLNFLANLLKTDNVLSNPSESIRYIIRFKTRTALTQLNSDRKRMLIEILYESELIIRQKSQSAFLSLALVDLTGMNFTSTRRRSYTCLEFERVILNNASFRHLTLHTPIFTFSELNNADFAYSNSPEIETNCAPKTVIGTTFLGAQMRRATFTKAFYANTKFGSGTIIDEGNFDGFECKSCDFRGTSLVRANFTEALFHGHKSFFSYAHMADAYLYMTRFKDNVDLSQVNMTRANAIRAEFNECLFVRAILNNCSFNKAIIVQSNMSNANLTNLDLTDANLTKVEFTFAIMRHVNMNGVFSYKSNFQWADLRDSHLNNGWFIENDFTNANITDKQFANVKSLRGSILPNGTVVSMND